jgi:hypothetical protein
MAKNLSDILRGANYGTLPIINGGTGATTAIAALTALDAQPTLISGTNIKTINSTSLLGTGDIVISGGSSGVSTGKAIAMAIVFGG